MDAHAMLNEISALSRDFGKSEYVRGGGGNSSCKDADTLWIKPSGITLAEMEPDKFLPLSRERLESLYSAVFPTEERERESAVATFMAGTVLPDNQGRPSVEAPLHNCFSQRYVVHTHPATVNGMTCGVEGQQACHELFPDALWLPVIEPGYTVSVRVRDEMARYSARHGIPPAIIFLANHGVFIAHDEPDGLRALYNKIIGTITDRIEAAGLAGDPDTGPAPDAVRVKEAASRVARVMGDDAACHAALPRFSLPTGAVSPDHIVYSRAALYEGDGSEASLRSFRDAHGYWPRVVALDDMVLGFGPSQKTAALAAELAWDAALVVRYAGAFGGISYLDQKFVDFIQNWEVESYRQTMVN